MTERTSFYDEQARRRVHARWWSFLSGAVTALYATPFALPFAPIAYAALLVLAWAIHVVRPLSPAVREQIAAIGTVLPDLVKGLFEHGPLQLVYQAPVLLAVATPGFLAMLGVWHLMRRALRRGGPDGILDLLRARDPDLRDPEERQLVHLVEEMAIAAGAPAPRVMLLDAEHPNGALVATSARDVVLVITRGTLDRLPRDDTQGLVAHLVASAINGDGEVAIAQLSVFRTIAVAALLLFPGGWERGARVLRWIVPGGREERGEEVVAMLDDVVLRVQDPGQSLLLRPLLASILRARRYLADATAVQLTREPVGVARGLVAAGGDLGEPPGGKLLEHLYVAGSEAVPPKRRSGRARRLEEVEEAAATEPFPRHHKPHPPMSKRLARLAAQGAEVATELVGEPETLGRDLLRSPGALLVIVLLAIPLAALMAMAIGVAFAVNLGFAVLVAGVPLWLMSFLAP
ncbi:MAG TPA: M48 family metalloprotease [Thermoanaerobaculia bacterium]|nr:M48 family metalloprotease [Thermoanaerobaculia bacterium]